MTKQCTIREAYRRMAAIAPNDPQIESTVSTAPEPTTTTTRPSREESVFKAPEGEGLAVSGNSPPSQVDGLGARPPVQHPSKILRRLALKDRVVCRCSSAAFTAPARERTGE